MNEVHIFLPAATILILSLTMCTMYSSPFGTWTSLDVWGYGSVNESRSCHVGDES